MEPAVPDITTGFETTPTVARPSSTTTNTTATPKSTHPTHPVLSPFSPIFISQQPQQNNDNISKQPKRIIQWKNEPMHVSLELARRISIVVHVERMRRPSSGGVCVLGEPQSSSSSSTTKELILVNPKVFGNNDNDNNTSSILTYETARLVAKGTEDWARTYRFHQVLWDNQQQQESSSILTQQPVLFVQAMCADLTRGLSRTLISIGEQNDDSRRSTLFGSIAHASSAFLAQNGRTLNEIREAYGILGQLFWECTSTKTHQQLHDDSPSNSPISCSLSLFEIEEDNAFVDLLASKPFHRESQRSVQIKYGRENCATVNGLTEQPVSNIEELGKALRRAFAVANHPRRKTVPGHTIAYLHFFQAGKFLSTASLFHVASVSGERSPSAEDSAAVERRNVSIRRALGALGNVLRGTLLRDSGLAASIPFRDSTLTKILQRPIEDRDSRLVVLTSISAGINDYENTLSTLRYASRLFQKPGQAPQSPFDNASKSTSPTSLGSLGNASSVNLEELTGNEKLLKLMLSDPRQRLAKIIKPIRKNETERIFYDDTGGVDPTEYMNHDPAEVDAGWRSEEIAIPSLKSEGSGGGMGSHNYLYEPINTAKTPLAGNTRSQDKIAAKNQNWTDQQKIFLATSLTEMNSPGGDDEVAPTTETSFRLDVMEQGADMYPDEPSPLTIDTYENNFHFGKDVEAHNTQKYSSPSGLFGWDEGPEDEYGLDLADPAEFRNRNLGDDLSAELREKTFQMKSFSKSSEVASDNMASNTLSNEEPSEFLDAAADFDHTAQEQVDSLIATDMLRKKVSNLELLIEEKDAMFNGDLAAYQHRIDSLEQRNQRAMDDGRRTMEMTENAMASQSQLQRVHQSNLRSFQQQQEEQMRALEQERIQLNQQLLEMKQEMYRREEKHLMEISKREEEAHRLNMGIRKEEQERRIQERQEMLGHQREETQLALNDAPSRSQVEEQRQSMPGSLANNNGTDQDSEHGDIDTSGVSRRHGLPHQENVARSGPSFQQSREDPVEGVTELPSKTAVQPSTTSVTSHASARSSKYPLPPRVIERTQSEEQIAASDASYSSRPPRKASLPDIDRIEELESRVKKLTFDREEAFRIAEQAIATQAELEEELENLRVRSKASVSGGGKEILNLQRQIALLKDEVRNREMTILEMETTNNSLEKECAYLSELKGKDDRSTQELRRQLGLAQKATEESKILRRELAECKASLDQITKEREEYDRENRTRLGEKDRSLRETEERLRLAEEELRITRSRSVYESGDLRTEIEAYKASIARHEDHTSKILSKLRSQERENNALAEDNALLNETINNLEAQISEKDKLIEQLSMDLTAKSKEIQEHETESKAVKKALKKFQTETRSRVEKVVAHRNEAAVILQNTLEENQDLREHNARLQAALEEALAAKQERHTGTRRNVGRETGMGESERPSSSIHTRDLVAYLATKLGATSSSSYSSEKNLDLVHALEDEKDAEIHALKQRIRRLERSYKKL